jgi:hypothetical protein
MSDGMLRAVFEKEGACMTNYPKIPYGKILLTIFIPFITISGCHFNMPLQYEIQIKGFGIMLGIYDLAEPRPRLAQIR